MEALIGVTIMTAMMAGMVGFGIGIAVISKAPNLYTTHVEDFQRCLADGAPRDNCLEKYLLPKDEK